MQRLLVEVGLDLPDLTAIGKGIAAPATEANCGRMKLVASSNSVVSESALLESASCRIGTLEALKLRIVGGVTPAGICFKTVCDIAETSASAALIFTVG
jgi:hypothetical protein